MSRPEVIDSQEAGVVLLANSESIQLHQLVLLIPRSIRTVLSRIGNSQTSRPNYRTPNNAYVGVGWFQPNGKKYERTE